MTSNNPLHRYFHQAGAASSVAASTAPYALITGSTGGMGEEWALQLAALGFNVIIQGRNRKKLTSVKEAILSSGSKADVRLLVTEATILPNPTLTEGLTEILADANVRLTMVINNLGVNTDDYPVLEDMPSQKLGEICIANAFFPAEVSRICLPSLKKHQPSLLVTITSLAAWATPPYLSPYCGTKGFDVAFSRSLHNEMVCEKLQVDIVCMVPGQVSSSMCLEPVSLTVPTSADWVKSGIASLRSTWWTPRPAPVITPWKPHAWGAWFMGLAPSFITMSIARSMIVDLQRKLVDSKKNI